MPGPEDSRLGLEDRAWVGWAGFMMLELWIMGTKPWVLMSKLSILKNKLLSWFPLLSLGNKYYVKQAAKFFFFLIL